MFTGIVSGVGRIVAAAPIGPGGSHGRQLVVQAPDGWLCGTQPGDSIAINGACMTVTSLDGEARFTVDVSAESLRCTTGLDAPGPVNLEQALRATDRLGGHLVAGHVDGIGTVTHLAPAGESIDFRLVAPRDLARFLAVKGSISVNGVSLTLNRVADAEDGTEVGINLVPHTLAHTTLATLTAGAKVNLEVDLIARYVERMLGAR